MLGGDFHQVLPVIPHGAHTAIVENCLKRSPLWSHFKVIKLAKNMCTHKDQKEFSEWVLKLGNGELKRSVLEDDDAEYCVEIPYSCVVTNDIVNSVFNEAIDATSAVILTPKNDALLLLNAQVLSKLLGAQHVYYSTDRIIIDNEESQNYPQEFLHSLTPSDMPEFDDRS